MDVKATLEERISKKGTTYYCLDVHITDTCTKRVFLEPAEVELIQMVQQKAESEQKDGFWSEQ